MYAGTTTIAEEDRQNVYKALEFLNIFLEAGKYVTGSQEPTLADVVIFVSVTNVVVRTKIQNSFDLRILRITNLILLQELGGDLNKYQNVAAWFERCKALPSAADNFAGAELFGERIRCTLKDKL